MKKKVKNKKFEIKLIFAVAFAVIGLLALQVPVNSLAGSNVKFTLFDLFAPASGAFLGTWVGVAVVFLMQGINILFHGTVVDKGVLIRLFPILFAVWFFARRDTKLLIIPILAILSFNLNPVGRSVWYYSLFWLVPIIMLPFVSKSLVARSLSATFIAHAVGGAIWIWAFHLPAIVWKGLIPTVILERSLFALGISANYILFNNIFGYLQGKKWLPKSIAIDKKYLVVSSK